jgi:hypothetical protein
VGGAVVGVCNDSLKLIRQIDLQYHVACGGRQLKSLSTAALDIELKPVVLARGYLCFAPFECEATGPERPPPIALQRAGFLRRHRGVNYLVLDARYGFHGHLFAGFHEVTTGDFRAARIDALSPGYGVSAALTGNRNVHQISLTLRPEMNASKPLA